MNRRGRGAAVVGMVVAALAWESAGTAWAYNGGGLSFEQGAVLDPRLAPNFGQLLLRRPLPARPLVGVDELTRQISFWNQTAIDISGIDHVPVAPGEKRVFGEQFGPARASRAMAIVHIAMFDAVNAIQGGYQGYTRLPPARGWASAEAAVAQAAHDTLVALYPSQADRIDDILEKNLRWIHWHWGKSEGLSVGRRAAEEILALRRNDGAQIPDPIVGKNYFPPVGPGLWRPDPVSRSPLALGAYWGNVRTFVLESSSQFRTQPPPALDSREYALAYQEVKKVGGDGKKTPTIRTPEQTVAGIYWAYDGSPWLDSPSRLYNQLTSAIAQKKNTRGIEFARLLALVNVTLADASIAAWESKYFYDFWRPVTGIREPDDNPNTDRDPRWTPLGGQASNLDAPDFTPPFPSYPSGHATDGSAAIQVMREYYGTDSITFSFVSDEFNGVTVDNTGVVRPFIPRRFTSLGEAEEENGQSRIYLGIHWQFDKTEGMLQGQQVGDFVFANAFRPLGAK